MQGSRKVPGFHTVTTTSGRLWLGQGGDGPLTEDRVDSTRAIRNSPIILISLPSVEVRALCTFSGACPFFREGSPIEPPTDRFPLRVACFRLQAEACLPTGASWPCFSRSTGRNMPPRSFVRPLAPLPNIRASTKYEARNTKQTQNQELETANAERCGHVARRPHFWARPLFRHTG